MRIPISAETKVSRALPTDLLMLVVVVIWGVNFSVVKLALEQFPPLVFSALRFVLAVVALVPLLRLREGRQQLPPGQFWWLAVLGFIGNTLYQICFVFGLSLTTAANAALLVATTPALVALLGAAFGVERITCRMGWGIALAVLGVGLIVAGRGVTLAWHTVAGDALVLVATFCWAIYTLGVRKFGSEISSLRITTLTMFAGTPGLLLVGAPDLLRLDWTAIHAGGWMGLGYSAMFALVLAYLLWNTSVRVVGSARTAIYGCAVPIIAALVAWPVLGERPKPLQVAGAVLIVAGVLLTRRPATEPVAPVAAKLR